MFTNIYYFWEIIEECKLANHEKKWMKYKCELSPEIRWHEEGISSNRW